MLQAVLALSKKKQEIEHAMKRTTGKASNNEGARTPPIVDSAACNAAVVGASVTHTPRGYAATEVDRERRGWKGQEAAEAHVPSQCCTQLFMSQLCTQVFSHLRSNLCKS